MILHTENHKRHEDNDHDHGNFHEHDHGEGRDDHHKTHLGHTHRHGIVDPSILTTERGIRALDIKKSGIAIMV
jgi:hypothetical protein